MTLIKNPTTGNFDVSNRDVFTSFGTPGQIMEYAGDAAAFSSHSWLVCDGSEYSVGTYPDLYAAIGNAYGGTSGSTFCVPDYSTAAHLGSTLYIHI